MSRKAGSSVRGLNVSYFEEIVHKYLFVFLTIQPRFSCFEPWFITVKVYEMYGLEQSINSWTTRYYNLSSYFYAIDWPG